jgi:hypothetical protein
MHRHPVAMNQGTIGQEEYMFYVKDDWETGNESIKLVVAYFRDS